MPDDPRLNGNPGDGNPDEQQGDGEQQQKLDEQQGDDKQQQGFDIPEEHRERGWAKKVKSEDDLFKQLNSMEELVGKKQTPFDFENATENEINDYLSKTRPESIDDYDWGKEGQVDDKDKEFFGKMLQDSGIPPYVGNKLIKGYLNKQAEVKNEMFSKEGFEDVLKQTFGDNYKQPAGETANIIKGNLSEKDSELLELMPNNLLGVVYRLTNNLVKDYGIEEGGDRGTPGNTQPGNVDEMRQQIKKQIKDLSSKPHSYEEKKRLQDKLRDTYKNDPRLKRR